MTFEPENIAGAIEVWVADDIGLSDGAAVSSWVGRIGGDDAAQATGSKQPLYRTTGIGGQPAVDFDGTDDALIYTAADGGLTGDSGHVFAVVLFDGLGGTYGEHVVWETADVASNTRYVQGTVISTGKPRVSERNASTVDEVEGGTSLGTGVGYFLEWRSTDTAYELRVDAALESLTVITGANSGDWYSQAGLRDNLAFGSTGGLSQSLYLNGKIAALVFVGGSISALDRNALHWWVQQKYGISLGATNPVGVAPMPPRPRPNLRRS